VTDSDDASSGDKADASGEESDADPQPAAVRQQQGIVALGIAMLTGVAVTVSIAQRFPDLALMSVIAGSVCGLLVYRLVTRSIFPDGDEGAEDDADTAGDDATDR